MFRVGAILTFGLILCFVATKGQVSVNGTVVNLENNAPLPYVNIWITGLPHGTSTNDDGVFELKIPLTLDLAGRTLSVSSIGFKSTTLSLSSLVQIPKVLIKLSPSVTQLSELVIRTEKVKRKNATDARKLVQKALNQISRNYPKKPYLLNTFYRHYCSENDSYVRLIEAAVDVYSPKNNFKLEEIPDDRLAFQITQLRRSYDFTENAKLFHPAISLNYLWSNDLTDFRFHNPLAGDLNAFDFRVSDTTNYDKEIVYVIKFSQNKPPQFASQSEFQGTLYLTAMHYAFIRTEITEIKEQITSVDSILSIVHKKSIYKEYQNRYYLDRLTNDVDVFYASLDTNKVIIDTLRHRSHIEMIANNVQVQPQKSFDSKEPQKTDLRKINYDSTFWAHYTVLTATALEDKIIADLSEKISIQHQFQTFNTVTGGGISIIESSHFQKLISSHKGTPLYVVLWSNWGHLNHLDLKPISFFKRMLKKERLKLLLVAVENSDESWLNNRNYYGLNQQYVQHVRLDLGFDTEVARSYLNNVFPYFISVNGSGTIVSQDPPLPNKEEVKPFLKALLRNSMTAADKD